MKYRDDTGAYAQYRVNAEYQMTDTDLLFFTSRQNVTWPLSFTTVIGSEPIANDIGNERGGHHIYNEDAIESLKFRRALYDIVDEFVLPQASIGGMAIRIESNVMGCQFKYFAGRGVHQGGP